MIVRFLDITIRNFFSYRKKQVIPLADQGLVLIEGQNKDEPGCDSNRAGKSVIIEALVWCISKLTIRGVKHDDVVNRFVKKNCMVKTRFEIEDRLYSVIRYCKDKKYQNALHLWCNGKPLHSRHKDVTQARLEDILGMDFSAFINSIVFGGTTPFALKTDADQKKILESFLRFGHFDEAMKRTKARISRTEEERRDLALKIAVLQGSVNTLRESISVSRKIEHSSCKDTRSRLDVLKKKHHILLAEKPPKSSRLVLEEEIRKAERYVEISTSKLSVCKDKISQCKGKIAKIHDDLHKRERFFGKKCPFCGIVVSEGSLAEIEKHFLGEARSLTDALSLLIKSKRELERRTLYGRKGLNRLTKKLEILTGEYSNWKHKISELVGRIETEESHLGEILLTTHDLDRLGLKLSRRVKNLLSHEHRLHILESLLEKLRFWEVGFGNKGIKSLIIQSVLPELNRKLKELADEIFQGTVHIEFVPTKQTKKGEERELFHIDYKAKRGSASYLGESSGGRRRVDICILLCFAWFARSSNVLLIDELLDSLDEAGREIVLSNLATLRSTVLVITHRQEVKAQIGQVWTVVKENGFSRVEMP